MTPYAQADSERFLVRFGIFAYLGAEETAIQYQPVIAYLSDKLPDLEFELKLLDLDGLLAAIERNEVDIVTTNPTHFLVIRHAYPLTGVLATLLARDPMGHPSAFLSGVVIVRAEDSRFESFSDLRGKRVAAPSTQHMGGFRAQVHEIYNATKLRIPRHLNQLVETGSHQKAVDLLLSGDVDAAFIRSGVLEWMAAHGLLDLALVRVLEPRVHPNFYFMSSTRLYPEWPVFALPHMPEALVRRIASALLALDTSDSAPKGSSVYGYTIPADYLAVEELARSLRLPPL
ncbi:MAG: phosphate/phosphite/phosphonate ABC transporter substrate-binding protein [Verrucomicrobia bacterium]|nr:phosphate/phosphite/phosphonate ABC transporter substrate-binding protein [Verrucomicrobiota bacterium]